MAVKLLLVEDVENLGRSGDIVSVRPGFARNFLLPQKLGLVADKQALQMQAKLQEERKKRALVDRQESEGIASKIEGYLLSTIVKVDHEGHMYGSVTALDVAQLLQEQTGIEFEKRSVQLKHPIKETGSYNLTLKLKEGITASIKLKVLSESQAQEQQGEEPATGAEASAPSDEEVAAPKKKKTGGRKKKTDASNEEVAE